MVVSDSSTLIVLLDLERMDLLSNLFAEVMIPPAVYREITFRAFVDLPKFVVRKAPTDTARVALLRRLLDPGESEAIALAIEENRQLVIDERKGRRIAQEQGLEIVGLLGIVYLNVRHGFLEADQARSFLEDAQAHGYRISRKLVDKMLEALSA